MRKLVLEVSEPQFRLFFLASILFFSVAAFSQTVSVAITDAGKKPIANASVKGTTFG